MTNENASAWEETIRSEASATVTDLYLHGTIVPEEDIEAHVSHLFNCYLCVQIHSNNREISDPLNAYLVMLKKVGVIDAFNAAWEREANGSR